MPAKPSAIIDQPIALIRSRRIRTARTAVKIGRVQLRTVASARGM